MSRSANLSVLMSTHNDAAYLSQALDSVLAQSYQDFDMVIVDDCSTDGTPDILATYHSRDKRLTVVRNSERNGLADSLNRGLALAQGAYIARVNSDERSLPERFAKQIAFLETNPAIGVLGTQVKFIDDEGRLSPKIAWEQPTASAALIWQLLKGSPFYHASTMMRSALLRSVGGYDSRYASVELHLWTKLALVTKFANLSEVLLCCRETAEPYRKRVPFCESNAHCVSHEFAEQLLGQSIESRFFKMYSTLMNDNEYPIETSYWDIFQLCSLLRTIYAKLQADRLIDKTGNEEAEKVLLAETRQLIIKAFELIDNS